MSRTKEITVYTVQELTGRAREHALEQLARWNTEHDWWDFTLEDAKRMGALLGFSDMDISFSGFWSQGDGASFTGHYAFKADAEQKIREETGDSEPELVAIAQQLAAFEAAHPNTTAKLQRTGHQYAHKYTVTADTFDDVSGDARDAETDKEFIAIARQFMDWIYCMLEKEHEYLTSEAACIETADANEYEFDASGDLA